MSKPTPQTNVGDPDQVASAKEKATTREQMQMLALRKFLDDPSGRDWMWDLLGFCYIFQPVFTGNAETYLREGKRNVGLRILAQIMKHHPDTFTQMIKENE